MSWMFEDICWCGNSDECNHKDCYRHMSHRKVRSIPNVFTCGMLKNTTVCPYFIEEEEEENN